MGDAAILVTILFSVLLFIGFFVSYDIAKRKLGFAYFLLLMLSFALLLSFGLVYGYRVGYESKVQQEIDSK